MIMYEDILDKTCQEIENVSSSDVFLDKQKVH